MSEVEVRKLAERNMTHFMQYKGEEWAALQEVKVTFALIPSPDNEYCLHALRRYEEAVKNFIDVAAKNPPQPITFFNHD